jgi:multiple sugar transport system substrate-binding protein
MRKMIIAVVLVSLFTAFMYAKGTNESNRIAGTVSIEVWSSLSGSKASLFDEQTARFNASQDNAKVTVIHQGGYSILRQKVVAAANSHTMPAVLIVDYLDVPWYGQLGLIKNLDGLFPSTLIDDFYPAMLNDLKFQDKLYGLLITAVPRDFL